MEGLRKAAPPPSHQNITRLRLAPGADVGTLAIDPVPLVVDSGTIFFSAPPPSVALVLFSMSSGGTIAAFGSDSGCGSSSDSAMPEALG